MDLDGDPEAENRKIRQTDEGRWGCGMRGKDCWLRGGKWTRQDKDPGRSALTDPTSRMVL